MLMLTPRQQRRRRSFTIACAAGTLPPQNEPIRFPHQNREYEPIECAVPSSPPGANSDTLTNSHVLFVCLSSVLHAVLVATKLFERLSASDMRMMARRRTARSS
jgi:hypothetical protein